MTHQIDGYQCELLYDEHAISSAVLKMVKYLERTRQERNITTDLVLLCNLNGAIYLTVDLSRWLGTYGLPYEVDYIQSSVYQHKMRLYNKDRVKIIRQPLLDLSGKHVIFLDDILETGRSIAAIDHWLHREYEPERVDYLVLLDKTSRHDKGFNVSYFAGIENVPDKFLFGYGLDLNGRRREMNRIFAVMPDEVA